MSFPKNLLRWAALASALLASISVVACSVETTKTPTGEDKNVNIETPVGDLHFSNGDGQQQTGLAIYPGAQLKEKRSNGDSNNANVSISTGAFGLKVAAVEYTSDDPPAKVQAFYNAELSKYGKPIECHTDELGRGVNVNSKEDDHPSGPVACESPNTGKVLELKVGTEDNQRVVAIEPLGKGTDFSVIYLRLRGKQGDI